MTDDRTIALDGEEYVLRTEEAGLKVGSRRGGDVVWLDDIDPSTLPEQARRALDAGDTGDAALQTALRGIVQAEVTRGG